MGRDAPTKLVDFFSSKTCLGIALIIYLALQSYGWQGLLTDHHTFRQAQTAVSARAIARGGPILAYETPVMGYPWSMPFEFPMYQTMVGKLSAWAGLSIEVAGRTISSLCFLLCVFFIGLSLLELGFSRSETNLSLCLLLLSPFYIFWSRTVLIEANALALSFAALWCFLCYTHAKSHWAIVGFLLFGAGAALVKITTFFAFAALIAVLTLYCFVYRRREWKKFIFTMAAQLVIVVVTKIWMGFSDVLKLQNILAAGMTSGGVSSWIFDDLGLRIRGETWNRFMERGCYTLGHKLFFVPFLFWPKMSGRVRWLFAGLLFLLFVPFFTFTILHVRHTYYAYANAFVFPVALAFFLLFLLRHSRQRLRQLGAVLLVASFALQISYYIRDRFTKIDAAVIGEKAEIDFALTRLAPDDVVLISGKGWSPEMPYYLDRRAAMFEFPLKEMKERARVTLERLRTAGYRVPLWFVCGDERPADLALLQELYLEPLSVIFTGPECQILAAAQPVPTAPLAK